MAEKEVAEEFLCRAICDYYASVTDELDLKMGHLYTIMQVSKGFNYPFHKYFIGQHLQIINRHLHLDGGME